MDQNKSGSLSDEDPAIVSCEREENDSDKFEQVDAPSRDLDLDLDLGLDLVMARVGLGKDHEKENLIPNQGE